MRGTELHQRLQFHGICAERTITARQPRLQGLNRTIQHNHAPGRLGDLPVFRVQESPAPESNDLSLTAGDALEFTRLNRPKSLLTFSGEDLGNVPSLRLHNLRIEIDKRAPCRCGNSLRPRLLSARRRAVKEESAFSRTRH